MKKTSVLALIGGAAFAAIVIASDDEAAATKTKDDTQKSPAEIADRYARTICKRGIEATAHDPSSIEWIDAAIWPVISLNDLFSVQATLRAKNAFGATILTRMSCKVRHREDDAWEVISVTEH